jgi:cation diffusion facilitator CzcD-associated flavoprotein CzcO
MEITVQRWREGTEEFVPHHVMADYIQDAAVDNGVMETISFDTRVNSVRKVDSTWQVDVDQLKERGGRLEVVRSVKVSKVVVLTSQVVLTVTAFRWCCDSYRSLPCMQRTRDSRLS